jgi:hypothetical protein
MPHYSNKYVRYNPATGDVLLKESIQEKIKAKMDELGEEGLNVVVQLRSFKVNRNITRVPPKLPTGSTEEEMKEYLDDNYTADQLKVFLVKAGVVPGKDYLSSKKQKVAKIAKIWMKRVGANAVVRVPNMEEKPHVEKPHVQVTEAETAALESEPMEEGMGGNDYEAEMPPIDLGSDQQIETTPPQPAALTEEQINELNEPQRETVLRLAKQLKRQADAEAIEHFVNTKPRFIRDALDVLVHKHRLPMYSCFVDIGSGYGQTFLAALASDLEPALLVGYERNDDSIKAGLRFIKEHEAEINNNSGTYHLEVRNELFTEGSAKELATLVQSMWKHHYPEYSGQRDWLPIVCFSYRTSDVVEDELLEALTYGTEFHTALIASKRQSKTILKKWDRLRLVDLFRTTGATFYAFQKKSQEEITAMELKERKELDQYVAEYMKNMGTIPWHLQSAVNTVADSSIGALSHASTDASTKRKGAATIGDGVEVRVSRIPNAGNGLFATREFQKNELITEYVGNIIWKDDVESMLKNRKPGEDPTSHVRVLVKGFQYVNGNRVPKEGEGGGSFANDPHPSQVTNAKFIVQEDAKIARGRIWLKAIKPIVPGDEIVVSYGEDYWIRRDEQKAADIQSALQSGIIADDLRRAVAVRETNMRLLEKAVYKESQQPTKTGEEPPTAIATPSAFPTQPQKEAVPFETPMKAPVKQPKRIVPTLIRPLGTPAPVAPPPVPLTPPMSPDTAAATAVAKASEALDDADTEEESEYEKANSPRPPIVPTSPPLSPESAADKVAKEAAELVDAEDLESEVEATTLAKELELLFQFGVVLPKDRINTYEQLMHCTENLRTVEVKDSAKGGKGVFAIRDIKEGEVISTFEAIGLYLTHSGDRQIADETYDFGAEVPLSYRKECFRQLNLKRVQVNWYAPGVFRENYNWRACAQFVNEATVGKELNAGFITIVHTLCPAPGFSMNPYSNILVITAARKIKKGEEILTHYGENYSREHYTGKLLSEAVATKFNDKFWDTMKDYFDHSATVRQMDPMRDLLAEVVPICNRIKRDVQLTESEKSLWKALSPELRETLMNRISAGKELKVDACLKYIATNIKMTHISELPITVNGKTYRVPPIFPEIVQKEKKVIDEEFNKVQNELVALAPTRKAIASAKRTPQEEEEEDEEAVHKSIVDDSELIDEELPEYESDFKESDSEEEEESSEEEAPYTVFLREQKEKWAQQKAKREARKSPRPSSEDANSMVMDFISKDLERLKKKKKK